MDKKIFEVYLAKEDVPNNEAYAKLNLPVSLWELWDAMEKVRLKDDEALYMEIDDYYAFEYLAPHLDGLAISLNELNDFAALLSDQVTIIRTTLSKWVMCSDLSLLLKIFYSKQRQGQFLSLPLFIFYTIMIKMGTF